MSTAIPPRPRQVSMSPRMVGTKRRFAIVASQYNAEYVQGLVDHAFNELRNLAPSAQVDLHSVPGAFEIPIVARELARHKKADAVIALGVIIHGKTDHAAEITRAVTDALQRIAIEDGIPIVHGVLSLKNETQARERCLGDEMNRGTEAARTAVQMLNLLVDLRER
ncbi:MAG TPA: 6,7-dimethyl-8-ribityllumazine synthase [Chthoniobacterales bacterium]